MQTQSNTSSKEFSPTGRVINRPGDFSVLLFDCEFAQPSGNDKFSRVINNEKRVIGVGNTPEQACWFARKTRQSEMMIPSHFEPLLENCSFGAESFDGVAIRTVTIKDPEAPNGIRILGTGPDKHTASKRAALSILRERPITKLSLDEFSRLCTVVTAEIRRGKSGKAKEGDPWLAPDSRAGNGSNSMSGIMRELRSQISDECTYQDIPAKDRAGWIEDRLNEIMTSPLRYGGMHHVPLSNNHHVILRTMDSSSAYNCIREAYNALKEQYIQQKKVKEQQKAGKAEDGLSIEMLPFPAHATPMIGVVATPSANPSSAHFEDAGAETHHRERVAS